MDQAILCGPGDDEPDYTGINSPTGRCKEHGDYLYYCSECHELKKLVRGTLVLP